MNWLTSRITPLALLASLALTACDKGTDLSVDLPNTEAISTNYLALGFPGVATVQVKPVESLKTDRYLIGRLTDNVAGTTTARSYFNTMLALRADSLPNRFLNPVLDSVVLVMSYDRVNGSAATPARFNVYSLAARLDEREVYISTSPGPGREATLRENVPVRLNRTRQVTSTTEPPVTTTVADPSMRLVLQRRAANGASNPAMSSAALERLFALMRQPGFNQAALDQELKGLLIEPATGFNTALLSFNRAVVPRMEMYFHEAATPAKWRAYPIAFGPVASSQGGSTATDPRYYTQIETDFSTSDKLRALTATTPVQATSNDGVSYLQEGVGLGTVINLSSVRELQDLRSIQGLTINRAELRVPLKPYSNTLFANPNGIFALEAVTNPNGGLRLLERTANFVPITRAVQVDGANPRGASSEAYSGPAVNSATTAPYYSLIITNYLQAYLNNDLDGELPTSLVLVPNVRRSLVREATLGLNRAAVDASGIKLYIYYSKQ